jgi:hypothetical protein
MTARASAAMVAPLALALALIAAPAAAQQPLPQAHQDHAAAPAASGDRQTAPPDAYCYIGWPNDGEVMKNGKFKVWFGTRNFGVAPAGVEKPNTGHHHLLIDTDLRKVDEPIPNDRNHLHFGMGQTEAMVELPPGTHTLQLVMGDANHVPHDPPVKSKKITIHVRAGTVADAR